MDSLKEKIWGLLLVVATTSFCALAMAFVANLGR